MRIGILTINGHYNYGNRLQNFALQTLLQYLVPNSCIETVWHTQNNYAFSGLIFPTRFCYYELY